MSAADRKVASAHAAEASRVRRLARKEPRVRTGIAPSVSLADVLAECAPALRAVDLFGAPDWSVRLATAATILVCFPRDMRTSPEQVRAMLTRAMPDVVLAQENDRKRFEAEQVYEAAQAEWNRLRIRHHPITGLYVEPLPLWCCPPWQSLAKLRRKQPKPQGRLERLEDGRLVLHRHDGDEPVVVEEDPISTTAGAAVYTD